MFKAKVWARGLLSLNVPEKAGGKKKRKIKCVILVLCASFKVQFVFFPKTKMGL